jgi:hypothetical protein
MEGELAQNAELRRQAGHMLNLYAVKVSRLEEPRNHEKIEVRTYTARRAELLALETYPGCDAHTLGVFFEGVWRCLDRDGSSPR